MKYIVFLFLIVILIYEVDSTNIAFGKPALQSSIYQDPTSFSNVHHVYTAELAVDGDKTRNVSHGNCTQTKSEDANPWWRVLLEGNYLIDEIQIYNRFEMDLLVGFSVYVLHSDNTSHLVYNDRSMPQSVYTIKPEHGIPVSSIEIRKNSSNLSLCEVQVFGVPACVEPPLVGSGRYNTTSKVYNVNTTLGIVCYTGYGIYPNTITCNDAGNWSLTNPVCHRGMCKGFPSPAHGKSELVKPGLYGGYVGVGAVVIIECNVGYTVAGHNYSECLSNGSWSNTFTKCLANKLATPNQQKPVNAALLAGVVGGGVMLCFLIAGLVALFVKRRKRKIKHPYDDVQIREQPDDLVEHQRFDSTTYQELHIPQQGSMESVSQTVEVAEQPSFSFNNTYIFEDEKHIYQNLQISTYSYEEPKTS